MAGGVDVDVEDAALDDVEVVACVALGDDFDVFGWDGLLDEGAEDDAGGVVVEVGEEEVGADGSAQAGELVFGFLVMGRFPVAVLVVGWGEGFGGDGGSARHVVVVWEALVVWARWAERRGRLAVGGGGIEGEVGGVGEGGARGSCGGGVGGRGDGIGFFVFVDVGHAWRAAGVEASKGA